jgi:hypothetical protein
MRLAVSSCALGKLENDQLLIILAAELCLRHRPCVERHESGMKYLTTGSSALKQWHCMLHMLFELDTALMYDFMGPFLKIIASRRSFLFAFQRWDTNCYAPPIEFNFPGWREASLCLSPVLRARP